MITQQWIKENVCATCGMVITNRWDNHRIYKECEKELAKKQAKL
jgi:DNA-directed RNA polymerase subunit N (RpoN/RPB10)